MIRLGTAFGHGLMMMKLRSIPNLQHAELCLDRELPRAIPIQKEQINVLTKTFGACVKIAMLRIVSGVTPAMIQEDGILQMSTVGAGLRNKRLTLGHSAVPTTTPESVVLTAPLVTGPGLTKTV